MSICAVSVAVHVCDCENIGDEEKAALLQFFHALGLPPVIREEHYYCSHDKERGQAAVQHILRDQHDYLTGGGRWATTKERCEKVSPGRTKVWVEDKYYNGRACSSAASSCNSSKTMDIWSDGCSADFKCASHLLFLTDLSEEMQVVISRNWFCSCHDKTEECDGGGRALKGNVSNAEKTGDGYFEDR
jgi:hypothetical protein